MRRFLVRRLAWAVLLVAVVSSGALLLTRLAPGDAASELYGTTSAQSMARERASLGLDQPIATQYWRWASGALRLDFGSSLIYRRPVAALVAERAANTAILAVAALLLATLTGIPAGIVTGSRRRGPALHLLRGVSLVLLSLPSLVTSLALVLLAGRTGWFPIGGMTSPDVADAGRAAQFADLAWHLVVPALALALPLAATLERLQSQAMADAVGQPFTLAALARGISRRRVVWRDAWRASAGPVASIYGFAVGGLLSGSFVVEVVTAWPGLGRLMYDGLRGRDLYLVAGCAAAGALFLAVGSLVSDLAHAWVEPRLREVTR